MRLTYLNLSVCTTYLSVGFLSIKMILTSGRIGLEYLSQQIWIHVLVQNDWCVYIPLSLLHDFILTLICAFSVLHALIDLYQ